MNINKDFGEGSKRSSFIGCVSFAILATTISLSLMIITGWQLGESLNDKLVMAAFGVLAVLGAHLLLAFSRPASARVRLVAIFLWLFCMAYVVFSQASFFCRRNSKQECAGLQQSICLH